MSDIFISYARKDNQPIGDTTGFVTQLNEALTAKGFAVWMDKHAIIPAGQFEKDIQKGILESDTFLLVISPHSLAPQSFCAREIAYALEHRKRLIPLIREDKDGDGFALKVPNPFAELDWIFAREVDAFDDAIARIEQVLRAGDQEYIHTHSRLLARSQQWDTRGRSSGFLLRRGDLKEAERWYQKSARSVDGRPIEPRPTPLQLEYLEASQRAARVFQRVVTGLSVAGLVIMSLLAAAVVVNVDLAKRRALESYSLDLAANAQIAAEEDSELALALAVEANRIPDPPALAQSILSRYAYAGGALVTRLDLSPISAGRISDQMTAIAFSPEGHLMAVGMQSGAIGLWNTGTFTFVRHLTPHSRRITSLDFSPDGTRLISGDNFTEGDPELPFELRLWHLTDDSYITLEGPSDGVNHVEFTPDGRTAISIAPSGQTHAWDSTTGTLRWQAEAGGNSFVRPNRTSGSLSADGSSIFVADEFSFAINVLDLETGVQTQRIRLGIPDNTLPEDSGCSRIVPHPDGRRLLCAGPAISNNPALYLIELANGQVIKQYQPLEGNVLAITFSADGTRFLTGEGTTIGWWDTESGERLHRYLTAAIQWHLAFTPDNEHAAGSIGDNTLALWDTTLRSGALDGRALWESPTIFKVAYDAVRRAFWVGDGMGIRALDETDGASLAQLAVNAFPSAMAVLPDGSALIATYYNRELARYAADGVALATSPVWRAPSGEYELYSLSTDRSGALAVSTALNTGQVIVWDTGTGTQRHVFNELTDAGFVAAALSPDGDLLGATGCYAEDSSGDCIDHRLLVWDLATGTVLYSVPAGQTGLAISPDGTRWAFMGPDYAILLVDVQSGLVVNRLYGHNSWVVALTFDPSGTRLLSSAFYDNNRIFIWDVQTGQSVRQTTVNVNVNVWELFFSAKGDYFFTLDYPTSIGATQHSLNRWRVDTLPALLDWTQQNRMWRDFTCAERFRFSVLPLCSSPVQSDTDTATAVALAPSRTPFPTVVREPTRTPYPSTATPIPTHIDTPTLTPTLTTYVYNTLYDVQWSPDGRRILAGEAAGYVIVWDSAERKELYRLSGHSAQSDFDGIRGRWSPDSNQIATYDGGQVQLWDAASGELRVTLNGHTGDVHRVVWSPNGALLASLGEDNTVRVWDAIVGSLRFVLSGHSASVTDAMWLGDGRLATASLDGSARIWDANTGLALQSLLNDGSAPLYGLAISPDGTRLLTTGASAQAIVWSLSDSSPILTFSPVAEGSLVYDGEWSQDGSRILLHTVDAPPSVWDAASGQRLYVLDGHNGFITCARWSPDGTSILTTGVDGTIRTWDVAIGAAGRAFDARSVVWGVAYSPDGASIVSTADDGTIRMWSARVGREMQFIFPPVVRSTSTAIAVTDLNAVLLALR